MSLKCFSYIHLIFFNYLGQYLKNEQEGKIIFLSVEVDLNKKSKFPPKMIAELSVKNHETFR
jgi:hypothetical protein